MYDNVKWVTVNNETNLWENCHDKARFIIKDEYVEFRKAQAEGKTIQCFRVTGGDWIDLGKCNAVHQNFEGFLKYYRIKPAEFKVGDYVINTETNEVYTFNYVLKELQHTTKLYAYKLWTLEDADDDEWVLVVNSNEFIGMTAKQARANEHHTCDFVPYIGQTAKQLGLEK